VQALQNCTGFATLIANDNKTITLVLNHKQIIIIMIILLLNLILMKELVAWSYESREKASLFFYFS